MSRGTVMVIVWALVCLPWSYGVRAIATPSTATAIAETNPSPTTFRVSETTETPLNRQVPPPFPSFNSRVLDQQLQRYRAYVQSIGVPDVLIVGSSRAIQGVDPIALQIQLQRQGHKQRRIYNFGINGATAQVVELLLREILPPEQLPRLVVWADGSRAFNSGRLDRTYQAIRQSPGYTHLRSGHYPTRFSPAPTWASLYTACRDALTAPDQPEPSAPACPSDRVQIAQSPRPLVALVGDQRVASGFAVVSDRFVPATYYQRFPRIAGAYDGDYQRFSLQGLQTEAAIRVVYFLRSRGIPLIMVNLPLTNEHLDAVRQQREAEFRAHMLRLAIDHGFWFRNLDRDALRQPQNFADPSHLNQLGAALVAEHLARDTTIPW
ncbi:MAG: hypothetical protein RML75_11770 [Cyanobacteriota bacterium SKYGB_h_bin112]|nr:hypothetical protein [Cyanobacteriota bacterium SKYGB_h_bin112]